MSCLARRSSTRGELVSGPLWQGRGLPRCSVAIHASKGFSEAQPKPASAAVPAQQEAPDVADAPRGTADSRIEAFEEELRRKRGVRAKVVPKVKVQSAVVDRVTGKAPAAPESAAEASYVSFLAAFFIFILLEGIVLAASGFLPAEVDAFVQQTLYPTYTPTTGAFLLASSLYGLWKTGKLPGQQQTRK